MPPLPERSHMHCTLCLEVRTPSPTSVATCPGHASQRSLPSIGASQPTLALAMPINVVAAAAPSRAPTATAISSPSTPPAATSHSRAVAGHRTTPPPLHLVANALAIHAKPHLSEPVCSASSKIAMTLPLSTGAQPSSISGIASHHLSLNGAMSTSLSTPTCPTSTSLCQQPSYYRL